MHPSVRAKVTDSGSQLRSSFHTCIHYNLLPHFNFSVYYRVYNKDGAIPTKRPAYLNDTYIGRIKSKWIAPPYNSGSLRLCLSSMENIDPSKTRLFVTSSSKAPLADNVPVSLKSYVTLGILPQEPLALFTEAIPNAGKKPGTESLRIPFDPQSPIKTRYCKSFLKVPCFSLVAKDDFFSPVYYGIYTEGGASASKAPVDPEEPWVSRLDLDLVPPTLSVTTLMHFISAKEGITSSSQLFADKETMDPLNDDHLLIEHGHWPGSTAEDHVMFKLVDSFKSSGFPTGNFRIRSTGTNFCWMVGWQEISKEGNGLCISIIADGTHTWDVRK